MEVTSYIVDWILNLLGEIIDSGGLYDYLPLCISGEHLAFSINPAGSLAINLNIFIFNGR